MQAVLDDWRTAPVDARLRAMLGFLEKLTLTPDAVSAADARALRAAGVSKDAAEEAIHVCTIFNVLDRLADSFKFDIPDSRGFDIGARMLLKRGYAF